jgi:hypothetical protein
MLEGYKTYILCIAAFLVALGAALTQLANGQTVEYQYVVDTLIALALLFLRKGIKTDSEKV